MMHWLDKVITLLQAETSNLRELARIAGADPRTFYRGIKLKDLDIAGQDIGDMEFEPDSIETSIERPDINIAIADIRRKPNQEERLALLIRLILENRKIGPQILKTYGADKAKYANVVLHTFNNMFSREVENNLVFFSDLDIARAAWRPFSRGMPNNRARLLVALAKNLGMFQSINLFLKARIANSSSVFIEPHRQTIEKYLNQYSTQK